MFATLKELSLAAADFFYDQIPPNQSFTLCPAAGNTPKQTYGFFVERAKKEKLVVDHIRIVMLDEWLGLPYDHPASCRHQILRELIQPLQVINHFTFNCSGDDREINRFFQAQEGAVDLCILGLGSNGHIALNEPGDTLQPYCHRAFLSEESQGHPMIQEVDPKPKFGITLGMQEILNSKSILLLVSGISKKKAFSEMITKNISTKLPASFLWLHPKVNCFYTPDVVR